MVAIHALASSSHGNAYAVDDGATQLLLECGIRFRDIQRGLGFNVSGLSGCLISHEHGDHSASARDVMRAGVDVLASRGTIDALGLQGHHTIPVRALEQFSIGTWTVLPFDTVHDATEPLGFLLASGRNKVLYATDTAYIRYRFQGLTHILIEANYSTELLRASTEAGVIDRSLYHRILRTHMSLERVLDFLRANDLRSVEAIWLLHLSDSNSDAAQFRTAVQRETGIPVYVAPRS